MKRMTHTLGIGRTWLKITGISAGFVLIATFLFASGGNEAMEPEPMQGPAMIATEAMLEGTETAVLAGGCFWGVEAVYEKLEGVVEVVSGYSGGNADTASYRMVGTGTTGHAEAVKIQYDPSVIDYRTLLEVFFVVAHDPTQLNYQGPDVGTEYRSAVFYSNEDQKRILEEFIDELETKRTFKEPIVTEIAPLDAFYPAEDYHQDFMRLNPQHPYILYWDVPKVMHLEDEFPDLIAKK